MGGWLHDAWLQHHPVDSTLSTRTHSCTNAAQIANQGEHLFDTAPSPGFLKSIFPCLRKGTPQASGSMAWVKLVDSEGRVAGHAVLSSRISMALLGGQVRHGVHG